MKHAKHTFLGTTQSLCPDCLQLLPAKIIARGKRVYFRKRCPTCGERDDFVCSDVDWFDRLEFMLPSQLPEQHGCTPAKGCPYDCGLCTDHEQHTCVGLVELTSSCNLSCPMCFASSGPQGKHLSFEAVCQAIDRLVEVEGRAEVLQLSGGEPTIHPEFMRILKYAYSQPIDYVMINTNGVRFAKDPPLVEAVAKMADRVEAFFQLDGLDRETTLALRGEDLLDIKLQALERLGTAGINTTLAVTLQGGVNDHEIGPIIKFAAERPWITAINFQPATYSGRHVLPQELENRITFPDVIKSAESQTGGMYLEQDFMPLPCAHPNCHSVAYAYRSSDGLVPLARFIDAKENFDLLANGITLTRARASQLITQLLGRQGCCGGDCGDSESTIPIAADAGQARNASGLQLLSTDANDRTAAEGGCCDSANLACTSAAGSGSTQDVSTTKLERANVGASKTADEFFQRALRMELGARDILRITITSFLDAYNFDVRRLMKCCTHHVLPSGHVIPFCAYNVLYREGHVPLPTLDRVAIDGKTPATATTHIGAAEGTAIED